MAPQDLRKGCWMGGNKGSREGEGRGKGRGKEREGKGNRERRRGGKGEGKRRGEGERERLFTGQGIVCPDNAAILQLDMGMQECC